MKLSTKNIDEITRKFRYTHKYIRKTCDCCICNKRIKSLNYAIGVINGFGGLNYYHLNCLINK